ncbi:unnamed protein product, partial [Onchocerca flexuosa]|uniref:PHB domain-containing protein n=1 Tax=Onchocerca flexuosa TaxID=387005 RepID=A0A183HVM5_9BILA
IFFYTILTKESFNTVYFVPYKTTKFSNKRFIRYKTTIKFRSTKLLAQTTLRNILGTKTLTEMLSDREAISLQMQITLDEATEPWGVKVERVEVKDVRLPIQLQRAMAAEAEAARAARAKGIMS